MSIVDSKTIDKIYEIPKGDYRNMRKNIREKFASYLKEKGKPKKFPWNSLSKIEQDYFICYQIYDSMMKNYIDHSKKDRIDNNIKEYLSNSLLKADELIKGRNETVSNIYEEYCKATDSESKKKKGYEQLCKDLQAYDKLIPLPSYESYAENPLRAYDYVCEHYYQPISNRADNEPVYDRDLDAPQVNSEPVFMIPPDTPPMDDTPPATQPSVPPDVISVIRRIILQVLEEAIDLKINYELINECLSSLSDGTFDEIDISPFDTFPDIPKDSEDSKKIDIDKYQMWKMQYSKKLEYMDMHQSLTPFYSVDYYKLEGLLEKARVKARVTKRNK